MTFTICVTLVVFCAKLNRKKSAHFKFVGYNLCVSHFRHLRNCRLTIFTTKCLNSFTVNLRTKINARSSSVSLAISMKLTAQCRHLLLKYEGKFRFFLTSYQASQQDPGVHGSRVTLPSPMARVSHDKTLAYTSQRLFPYAALTE